ncbi:hypothetical protein [Asaia astilbis]|uniref:hypothetical protein n=1 Tax=Asaia astilbis TaxID=610244 RepID=UPI0004708F0B|nr:hypothetical protein [Asaia astilbis]
MTRNDSRPAQTVVVDSGVVTPDARNEAEQTEQDAPGSNSRHSSEKKPGSKQSSADKRGPNSENISNTELFRSIGAVPSRDGAIIANDFSLSGDGNVVSSGSTIIVSSAVASGITVQNGGSALVQAGGAAINFVASGSQALVATYGSGLSAAVTSSLSLLDGARQDVGALREDDGIVFRGSAMADRTHIGLNASQWVGSGGTVLGSVVSSGGTLLLSAGGTGENAVVLTDGRVEVAAGAILNGATVSGTSAYVATYGSGSVYAVTSDVVLQDDARQDVGALFPDKTATGPANAYRTQIGNGTYQWVASGGTATQSLVSSGGTLEVKGDGYSRDASVGLGGTAVVEEGGTVTNTSVTSGGTLGIWNGGVGVNDTIAAGGVGIVHSGGTEILSGGSASRITVEGGGNAYVQAGGTALDFVASGSQAYVATYGSGVSAAVTSNLTLLDGARQDVGALFGDKGIASRGPAITHDTHVGTNAYQWVGSGGTVLGSVVSSGGTLLLSAGGTGENAVVLTDGRVEVAAGATLNGAMVSGTSAYVATYGSGSVYAVTSDVVLQDGARQDVGALFPNKTATGPAHAYRTQIGKGTYQWVASGGTATQSLVSDGGRLLVSAVRQL